MAAIFLYIELGVTAVIILFLCPPTKGEGGGDILVCVDLVGVGISLTDSCTHDIS